jgi:hypothetical protein
VPQVGIWQMAMIMRSRQKLAQPWMVCMAAMRVWRPRPT